jgi:hypothetical protein
VAKVTTSRANGLSTLVFHHPLRPSVMLTLWTGGQVREMTVFIDDRTVW